MVLRRADEAAPDSHVPPTTANMQPASTGQQRTLQSDIAALHLDSPAHGSTPQPDSDHEDSNSDWDASEREDEGEQHHPATKSTINHVSSSQPLHQGGFQPPPGPPPNKPPALNVSFGGTSGTEDELVGSPWADVDGVQSTTSTRTNNPFRRPTDQTPIDKASKHASVWNALGHEQLATQPEDSNANGRVSPVSHSGLGPASAWEHGSSPPDQPVSPLSPTEPSLIDLDPSNPWEDNASGLTKGKAKAPAINVDSGNPWNDQAGKAQIFSQSAVSSDKAATAGAGSGIDLLSSDAPVAGKSASKVPQQRNEIYQVKRVRWLDPRNNKNSRESPILVQNANGPCPLLALVNALSLSTPPGLQTELIRTLQRREQISLGLLIDAVFEELMSGRRGSTAQELPDVSELHAFLVTLHTGMNVNPKFIQDSATPQRAGVGTFEATKEMTLYSTFAVPLVHGWVPAEHEDAHAAFARTAPTYEDAQNVQFREEEIQHKLGTSTLSQDEQSILVDLAAIKDFFSAWPTQLTEYGLGSIKDQLPDGSISILFRNDHFSTIYKEPKSKQIMTLMTDAGYASHQEIVWESLVDISGRRSDMFSGDFRSVSHTAGGAGSASQARASPNRKPVATPPAGKTGEADKSHTRSQSEQEDHDLALALQLQEEEDQRHRNEQAARRREDELSQQYLSGDTPQQRPQIPPRRSNRPATHRPDQEQDPELPTYEEAQAERRTGQGPPPNSNPAVNNNAYISPYTSYGRRRGRTALSGPFDNQRRNQTEYDSFADRREGCTMM